MDPAYIQNIIEAIGAVGVVVFAVAQWRNGRSVLSTETVQTYKDLLDATEKKYAQKQDEMQKQLNDQATKLGELTGILSTREKQIADYKQILENRNPNLEKILSELVHFMEQVDARLTAVEAKKCDAPVITTTVEHK